MRTDRASAEEDWLNDFWDQRVDGTAPASDAGHHPTAPEQQLETLVLYLESLKPLASPSQLVTLRNTTSQTLAREVSMNAQTSARPAAPVTTDLPRRRSIDSRLSPVVRAFDGLAATLLILVVVSGLVLVGPARNFLDSEVPGRFASMLGMDEDESTEQGIGSHSMTSIEVRPGAYEGGRVEVGLWEVELLPDSALIVASSGDEPPMTFGFWVSSGAVAFEANGDEQTVGPDGSVDGHPELKYVRNTSSDPAHLFVLAPTRAVSSFPLNIGAWLDPTSPPPTSPPASTPTVQPEPILVSSVELTDEDAFQYRVLASEYVLVPGMGIGDVESFGPPSATLHAITVREGQLAVVPDESLATPEVTQELVTGDTVQLEADGVWDFDLRVTGSRNATVLGLLTMPAADNPTLNQSIESVAPFWGEWTVPESGEISLEVRRLTLGTGATYDLPTGSGVIFHVASGTVTVTNLASGISAPVEPGGTFAQLPGTVLTFINPGPEPVELIQTLVSRANDETVYARESLDGVTVEWLVRETERLSPGDVSLMLEAHAYNGENDGASAGQGPSLVLITSSAGEISARRDGGEAEVVTGTGEGAVTPPLGEEVRIGPGGYLLAQPGAGWFVTGASGAPSTAIVFSVSPDIEQGARPIATPAPGDIGTVTLIGDASSCDITPLTVDGVTDLLATPSTSGSPLDRSLREADGNVADRLTVDAIVHRMQEYADCIGTGDYARIYAFYSDQAIRESDVIQDLVRSGHDVGHGPGLVNVEGIKVFPDGRAGARVVIDGEAAYLTFVMENGNWQIDVWDDSDSRRPPDATPAS